MVLKNMLNMQMMMFLLVLIGFLYENEISSEQREGKIWWICAFMSHFHLIF